MNFTAHNFPNGHQSLNGTHAFPISTLDIARASVTVGYGGGYTPYNPMWLLPFHAMHFIMPIFLLEPIGEPSNFRPFLSLVPRSIRRYAAERLAMAVTKLWADKFLQIPWLIEVEFLEALRIMQFDITSGERPDLAGQDGQQRWYILEVKGRPNSTSIANALARAKRQAGRVLAVNGTAPNLTIGSILHSIGNSLHLTLDDPPPTNEDGITAMIREDLFYFAYYMNIHALISLGDRKTRNYRGRTYVTIKVANLNYIISLGLMVDIYRNVLNGVNLLRKDPIERVDDGPHSIGGDGTALFID